jgi:hypothetical protein
VLSKTLACATGAIAVLVATAPVAAADEDKPTLPSVNVYPPISPADFTMTGGEWYAFSTPNGLTCVIDKYRNGYGCSGPIPAAPNGANLVSGLGGAEPGFANTAQPLYAGLTQAKQLPPQTRLGYRNVSCAIDASGALICQNTATQHGFMLSPAGSFTA